MTPDRQNDPGLTRLEGEIWHAKDRVEMLREQLLRAEAELADLYRRLAKVREEPEDAP